METKCDRNWREVLHRDYIYHLVWAGGDCLLLSTQAGLTGPAIPQIYADTDLRLAKNTDNCQLGDSLLRWFELHDASHYSYTHLEKSIDQIQFNLFSLWTWWGRVMQWHSHLGGGRVLPLKKKTADILGCMRQGVKYRVYDFVKTIVFHVVVAKHFIFNIHKWAHLHH